MKIVILTENVPNKESVTLTVSNAVYKRLEAIQHKGGFLRFNMDLYDEPKYGKMDKKKLIEFLSTIFDKKNRYYIQDLIATRTIDKIIHDENLSAGAPMGRSSHGKRPTDGKKKIFDCKVELSQGYDKGGVYWGASRELRVAYTQDLEYVEFYRVGDPKSDLAKAFERKKIEEIVKRVIDKFTHEQCKTLLWNLGYRGAEDNDYRGVDELSFDDAYDKLKEYYIQHPNEILESKNILETSN